MQSPLPLPHRRRHRHNQQEMDALHHQRPLQQGQTPLQHPHKGTERHQPQNPRRHTKTTPSRENNHSRIVRGNPSTRRVLAVAGRHRTRRSHNAPAEVGSHQRTQRQEMCPTVQTHRRTQNTELTTQVSKLVQNLDVHHARAIYDGL